ncbi:GGDEF and EAL domain-containing protein [Sporosarcina sp. Sa2YVA2]|uniref:GGDEF and EAL domain-containing protein n=1 Tax=Sporosarcina quadrami TaxID=2762234 RepID=A0ABR8U9J1_9BACL|nr:GGDEF and EAL domain-containing protein [Sporosarcina quadrami]MBD7984695.1 GGDEF and EAL domain-containing protein [Sporosarcina quadrami]
MKRSDEDIAFLLEELSRKQEYIFTQAKHLNISMESISSILEELCMRIAKIMSCEQISIWLFNKEYTVLTSQMSYLSSGTNSLVNEVILETEVPSYFAAIQQQRVLAVSDVANHPATSEIKLKKTYRDGKIQSMIDASIILSKGIGGIVCCESYEKREWTNLDKVLVASIADMLSFIFDRIERIEVEQHVHKLAYQDLITGLDNQHSFAEKVTKDLHEFRKEQKSVFIYFVLDQFTEVQGVLGPEGSEKILKVMADRLKEVFQLPSRISRIGFDHFIVFHPYEKDEQAEIEKLIERMMDKMKFPMYISGQEVYMTISLGVAIYPDHVLNVKYGIQASYMALQSGRKISNRKATSVYKDDMHTFLKESMLSEMNLRKGLDLDEFELHFQPQVNCRTGEVVGFEALLRWRHPERGLIFPAEFIELAESTGLITPIGEWVIKEATQQIRKWQETGIDNISISINLSPRHFLHQTLPLYLEQCIAEARIGPDKVVLEITENVALEDQTAVISRIKLLKEMGYSISIDDFGKGYSAFIYLQHFPIHEIKIDREFISELGNDIKSTGIVQTIIHLAEMLGLRTIGEGVETKEQWDILKQLGCSDLQGYYFSRPLEVDVINGLFEEYGVAGKLLLPYTKDLTAV